jgi:DNA-binding transcriptional MerR regulator
MGKRKKPIQFDDKKLFHSIQDVADHFAEDISTIRFWEKEFDNIKPKKSTGGTRQYSKEDVKQLEMVYYLVREKKFTIEGARRELISKKDDIKRRAMALDKLQDLKKELLSLSAEFDELHEIQKYSSKQIDE